MEAEVISAGARSGHGLWLRWVLANSLAETVGLGASFAMGAAVGTAQWLVLRRPFPHMRWRAWALATAVGAFAAWTLGMLPSTLINAGSGAEGSAPAEPGALVVYGLAALMGLVAGTILGAPQWLVLRRHVRRAFLWVPANALAWAPGMVLAFVAAEFIFANGIGAGEILLAVITLALIGALVGAIYGAVLVWLLRSHRKAGQELLEPDPAPGSRARKG